MLVGITITGIVYAIVLAPIVDLHGLSGPYPSTNVTELGYLRVIVNGMLIIVLILAVGAVFRRLDRKLPIRP